MFKLLVVVAAIALAIRYLHGRRRRDSVSDGQQLVAALVRKTRVALGQYDLKTLMIGVVGDVLASGVHSLTTTYVPNDVTVGLHETDAARYELLLDEIVKEIGDAVVVRAKADPTLTLRGAKVTVRIVVDEGASPGRPSVKPRIRRVHDAAPRCEGSADHTGACAETSSSSATRRPPCSSPGTRRDEQRSWAASG